MTQVDDDAMDGVAFALLMAAILLRDMADAMPVSAQLSMPPDIRDRFHSTMYQDAFEGLPVDVKERARRAVESDPTIVAARAIDAAAGGER